MSLAPRTDGVVQIRPFGPADRAGLIAGRDDEFDRFLGPGDPEPAPLACVEVAGELAGWVDYDVDRSWLGPGEVNIGYHLFAPLGGRGRATTAVRLLLAHLAEDTDHQVATFLIHPDNVRSQALALRVGCTRVPDLDGNPYYKRRLASPTGGHLVIVCGLSGAGKTTLSRELEASLGAVRMCPDEWMAALGIDVWDQRARGRVEELQWVQATRLLQLGQTAVVEWGTWQRSERERLRDEARALGATVELRYLDEPIDVLWARVETRGAEAAASGRALTRADIEEFAKWFEVPTPDELASYDHPPSS